MSTLTGEDHASVLKSEKDLAHYFAAFAKPSENMRVGIEAEFFAVDRKTGRALPYSGSTGIHAILAALAKHCAYEPIFESGSIIALKRGDLLISLEPGGQVELSAPPVSNVFKIENQLQEFFGELRRVQQGFQEVAFLAVGMQPFSSLDEITWVPKRRYAIMADYLRTHGTQSHEMMKRTATNQLNVDYLNEENAMSSLRVALGITSIVTALFANSSFSDGTPNGFLSRRLDIWNHTSPERAGLIVEFTRPGKTFQDYLNYLLDMPLIFFVRHGNWIPVMNISFRQFIHDGFQGMHATLGDFELHLSTAFPEVRLKQYLEIRGVDCQSPYLIPAVAAFWKGIIYDTETRERAWKLVSFANEAERLNLHRAVPKQGLRAQLGTKPILPIARELVELSCASLAKQIVRDEKRNECIFIQRIREKITGPGKSPAEMLLERWTGEFGHDPGRLISYLNILR